MAHSDSRVVVSGITVLNKFRIFLERLSEEIEEDEFQGMKFILADFIPSGYLEKCSKPRDLFSRMIHQGLLGEDNLDYLEILLTSLRRPDLVERVRAYRQSESPGNVIALDFLYFYLSWMIFDIITSRIYIYIYIHTYIYIYIYIYITDWKK